MDPKQLWRRVGGVALGGAMLMLLLGLTIFEDRLGPAAFLGYWTLCFGLTLLSMIAAFMDLRRIRAQSRDQHRKLIESALTSVDAEAKKRAARAKNGGTGNQPRG